MLMYINLCMFCTALSHTHVIYIAQSSDSDNTGIVLCKSHF